MKRLIYSVLAMSLIVGLGAAMTTRKGGAQESFVRQGISATTVAATPMVKMSKDAKVTIKGTGFKPGQMVNLLVDTRGVPTDIGSYLKPQPVADDKGELATTWSCGRYVTRRKLIKEGVTVIKVTDSDYNLLGHASVAFYEKMPAGSMPAPIVTATPMVKMTKDAKVTIKGTGFKPGQVVKLLVDTKGVPTDIGSYLKPQPLADDKGELATTWSCGRYVTRRKLIKEGVTVIRVTDSDYTLLGHASVAFYEK